MSHSDAPHNTPPHLMFFAAVMGSGLAYVAAFHLNFILFDRLQFSQGVNWVFLPSGLRLLLVLVLGAPGALGLALGSILINYQLNGFEDHFFNIGTGLISGGAPLLARILCVDLLKMQTNLEGLTTHSLFKISVLFAVISALLHQMWFFWLDHDSNFASNAPVMAMGDWLGTALVLKFSSWALKFKRSSSTL